MSPGCRDKISTAQSAASPRGSMLLERLSIDEKLDPQSDRQSVPPLLDRFTIVNPQGDNACLVTIPARMSLCDAKNGSNRKTSNPRVARTIIAPVGRGRGLRPFARCCSRRLVRHHEPFEVKCP